MRSLLALVFLVPFASMACTSFKVTQDSRTLIGCNEDAWSINAQVRFEQGREGQYGGIYLGHFNGSPLRIMMDQMGMNEAGLVFDGFSLPPRPVKRRKRLLWMETSEAVVHAMRTCATVNEVLAFLHTVDAGPVSGMLFFCDAKGDYLVVEPDTMLIGHDAWYALGNWRMSSCSDPSSIPIPRLQAGRALLAGGIDASVDSATMVLESMKSCRSKLGEGTLFSAVFDPTLGQAHLYFYHDFRERISFDLKEELAKGDRTIDMVPLFGDRPEFDALVGYITPFHHRWLFWTMVGCAMLAVLIGLFSAVWFLRDLVRRIRGRRHSEPGVPLLLGSWSVVFVALVTVLLLNEAPYYFGLADVHPALAWLPIILIALLGGLFHFHRKGRAPRWSMATAVVLAVPVLAMLGYWHLLCP